MQAFQIFHRLMTTGGAIALGLALAWIGFLGWTNLVGGDERITSPRHGPSFQSAAPAGQSNVESPKSGAFGSTEHEGVSAERPQPAGIPQPTPVQRIVLDEPVNDRPIRADSSGFTRGNPSEPSQDRSVATHTLSAESTQPTESDRDRDPAQATTTENSTPRSLLAAEREAITQLFATADRHFETANFVEAIARYRVLLPNSSGLQRRMTAVKIGIANEHVGDLPEAFKAYSASLTGQEDDELSRFARLRMALLLAAQGHLAAARMHLADWWLGGGLRSTSTYEQQAVHLLGEIQARIACRNSAVDQQINSSYLRDDLVVWPSMHLPPDINLTLLTGNSERNPSSGPATVARVELIDRFSRSPDDTFVSLDVSSRRMVGLLDSLCRQAELSLSWSEVGYRRAEARNVSLKFDEINLALLFDLLARGSGLVWIETPDGIVVASETEVKPEDLDYLDGEAARRLLHYAGSLYPACPRARLSLLALGNLAFHDRQFADASRRYAQLVERSNERSWVTEAALNLGKSRLMQHDLEGACAAFLRSSDVAVGHPCQQVALLYAGRAQVNLNRVPEAVLLFSRALTLARGGELEAEALLNLSSIYAYLGNPVGANRVLLDHRDAFQRGTSDYDTAAFLSCYCRYQLAQTNSRRIRDGKTLLDALAHVDPTEFFSMQGWALVLNSYRDLGLYSEHEAVLQTCITHCEDTPFRATLLHSSIEDSLRSTSSGVVRTRLDQDLPLAGIQDETLVQLARLRSLSYTGDHAALLSESAILMERPLPEAIRMEVFDLMGMSYQRQGEHLSAALCFARINPLSSAARQWRSELQGSEPPTSDRGSP